MMVYKRVHGVTILLLAMTLTLCVRPSLAQSPDQEKPRLRRFGESLNQDFQKRKEEESRKAASKPSKDDNVLRLKTTLVTLDVLVLDKQGRAVTGLKPEDFAITEDNRPQQISLFSLGNDAAIARAIVLIIDYSSSQLPYIHTSIDAAKALVDQLNPKDKMAIVTDDVEMLTDFTSDKRVLKRALESLRDKADSGKPGFSLQFTALMATLTELFSEEDLRPIVIFQTDGDEATRLHQSPEQPPPNLGRMDKETARYWRQRQFLDRRFTLDDVIAQVEKSRATIYSVIPGEQLVGLSADEQIEQVKKYVRARMKALPERPFSTTELPREVLAVEAQRMAAEQLALCTVAKLSGGWFEFLTAPAQAAPIYARMLSDINMRYVLGFYPANEAQDGKRRKVSIQVLNHPEYLILGRTIYYSKTAE
jgi:VWFA-related protein